MNAIDRSNTESTRGSSDLDLHLVCVTADDYGMHRVVNEAIEDLAANGSISAAAVMVHDGALLDTRADLQATDVALGLHLVFTQERPVLAKLVGTALAPEGRLPASPYALMRVLLRRPQLRPLLFQEIEAQFDRYASLGLPLDFVNSHEHAHEVPLLSRMVGDLVERRCPAALRSAHVQPITPTRQGLLALLSRASRRLGPSRTPRQIWSPMGAGQAGHMGLREIDDLLARGLRWHCRDGVVPELVVHPAVDDRPLHARYGHAAGQRRAEYDLLRSDRIRDLWHRRSVALAIAQ